MINDLILWLGRPEVADALLAGALLSISAGLIFCVVMFSIE